MDREGSHFEEFGDFRLDLSSRLLWVNGRSVQMPPKELQILCILAERQGSLVTKDELMAALWPDSFVEESNLTRHIYLLRKQLREIGQERELIENIPTRGYRLKIDAGAKESGAISDPLSHQAVSPGSNGETDDAADPPLPADPPRRTHGRLVTVAISLAIAAVLALAAWNMLSEKTVSSSERPVRSIAVLPFTTVGEDADAAYLGPGITETLIHKLSRIRQIVVKRSVSPGTPSTIAGDLKVVGERLGVDAVVDGAVQRSGDKVRITARLILVRDGTALWNETFEDHMTDLFDIQDLLSARVANSLSVELTGSELQAMQKRGTSVIEAEQLYLRGRYFWNRRSRDGFIRSIELYNEAIKLDRNFARPYSGIADAYLLLGDYGYLSPKESTAIAKDSALNALALDDSLVEAHTSLAYSLFLYDWAWEDAETSFKRALALDPNYPTLRQWYAEFLIARGRSAEARVQMEAAQQLDPQSPSIVSVSCWITYIERDFVKALDECRSAIEMDATLFTSHFWTGQTLEKQGQLPAAIQAYRKALELSPESDEVLASLAHALGKNGERNEAGKLLARLKEKSRHDYVSSYFFAIAHLGLGDKASAIASLESALNERSRAMPFLTVDPMLDELRSDPAFIRLLDLAGLESSESEK